jgi:hypothetical protein
MAKQAKLRSLVMEAEALRKRYPAGEISLKRGVLSWKGTLKPTASSATYTVVMSYDWLHIPRVYVLSPALVPDGSNKLPHIYADGALCLHTVDDWAWDKALAHSIVPWTSEWLFFYEIWKATGHWQGSGGDQTGPVDPDLRTRALPRSFQRR